ncbi:tetratricopeptide repeat protein [Flavihumibacter fluvii]|uniref:tetratricopeptide repeat protein n=1 Tax=Flavihumibacter fluvii TaxID=2838157 RepID=UPI001BDEF058|nr:tetratricopeptide repeat protein [Flavihumibacter fluvii]ULQ51321.1 tetratricopeptide repeat protein [Flavihumibacter fluvii]
MNFKLILLATLFFATPLPGNAQVYSKNKAANSYYNKALDYIKIGNPRNGGSVDSLLKAVQWLENAVETDPLFVTAYIELCKTYWLFDFSYPDFPKYNSSAIVILPKAKAAIYNALRIDSTLSEAYSQLARMNKNYEYNWDEALRNYTKAIHYDSSNASNYAAYGETLALKGQWEDAQKWIDKANRIAPNDSRVLLTTGIYYYWKRDYENASKSLTQISPQTDNSKFFTGLTYVAQNEPSKAITVLKAQNPMNNSGGGKALMAYALIKSGKIDEARKILKQIEELNQVVEYRSAACYAALGEYDKAFELLHQYYKRQGNWMTWFKYDKSWDPIRNDIRYQELLSKMPFDK